MWQRLRVLRLRVVGVLHMIGTDVMQEEVERARDEEKHRMGRKH